MREYKYLSQEEVAYYRSLNEEEIEDAKLLLIRSMFHGNIKMNEIKLDEPFHVENGDWDGVIYKESDRYYMNIFIDIGDGWIETRDITKAYEQCLESGLDISYVIDDKKLSEFYKIYNDKTTYLYGADENCNHEIEGAMGGGVKCLHCNGWYCA